MSQLKDVASSAQAGAGGAIARPGHRDPAGLWYWLIGGSLALHALVLLAALPTLIKASTRAQSADPVPVEMVELDTAALPTAPPDTANPEVAPAEPAGEAIAPNTEPSEPTAGTTELVPSPTEEPIEQRPAEEPTPTPVPTPVATPSPPPDIDTPSPEAVEPEPESEPPEPPSQPVSPEPETASDHTAPQPNSEPSVNEPPPSNSDLPTVDVPNTAGESPDSSIPTEPNPDATGSDSSGTAPISTASVTASIVGVATAPDAASDDLHEVPPEPRDYAQTFNVGLPEPGSCALGASPTGYIGYTVAYRLVIEADGTVSDVHVEDDAGLNQDFLDLTECLIKQWQFEPASDGGQPVADDTLIVYLSIEDVASQQP